MTEQFALDAAQAALVLTMKLSLPLLLATLFVGTLVSVFQAVTQINDATLSFVPKLLVVVAAVAVLGPWMGAELGTYTVQIFEILPTLAR